MLETMASFMLVEHANGAMFDPRWARDLPADSCTESQAVPTSDGHIAVLIYNERHWSAFVNAVQPPWASDLGADAAQGLA
ncbi:MAG: hypothetical protein QOI79_1866 [Mycobacterium sp.]|nr:hypothetical protein [Mycobacterium sp.]